MEAFKIDDGDLKKVKLLYETIPSITLKMMKFMDYRKAAEPIKKEIRALRKEKIFLPKDKANNYKIMMQTLRMLQVDYNSSITEWNDQMNILLKKYNYVSLTEFLGKYPLESIGNKTSKMFSINIKKITDLAGIQILKSLYSGDPKMTNNYPEKWLLLVYEKIDKISDHEL